jgi:hypothetical protein
VLAPVPLVEEKIEKIEIETVTAKAAPTIVNLDLTSRSSETLPLKKEPTINEMPLEPEVAKMLTRILVPKLPTFKGAGPFKFSLALTEQGSSKALSDPDLAIGLKVISQTPAICKVSASFNKTTNKYSISVTGISNGQCKITALDKGGDEKFPTAIEIKQVISGVPTKKITDVKGKKVKPAPKSGVTKVSYKPS